MNIVQKILCIMRKFKGCNFLLLFFFYYKLLLIMENKIKIRESTFHFFILSHLDYALNRIYGL